MQYPDFWGQTSPHLTFQVTVVTTFLPWVLVWGKEESGAPQVVVWGCFVPCPRQTRAQCPGQEPVMLCCCTSRPRSRHCPRSSCPARELCWSICAAQVFGCDTKATPAHPPWTGAGLGAAPGMVPGSKGESESPPGALLSPASLLAGALWRWSHLSLLCLNIKNGVLALKKVLSKEHRGGTDLQGCNPPLGHFAAGSQRGREVHEAFPGLAEPQDPSQSAQQSFLFSLSFLTIIYFLLRESADERHRSPALSPPPPQPCDWALPASSETFQSAGKLGFLCSRGEAAPHSHSRAGHGEERTAPHLADPRLWWVSASFLPETRDIAAVSAPRSQDST